MRKPISRWAVRVLGLFMCLIGLCLTIGGGYLALLHGPIYHLAAGIGLVVSGAFLATRRSTGIWIYLAVFAATLGWAVIEVGSNSWALIPWLIAPSILLAPVIAVIPILVPARRWPMVAAGLLLWACTATVFLTGFPSRPADVVAPVASGPIGDVAWSAYGGASGGGQFASSAISPINVATLEQAWTFQTGELGQGLDRPHRLTFETNPLIVDRRLYASTAFGAVFALDAANGKPIWRYDPEVSRAARYGEVASRGVSYWEDAAAVAGPCRRRIFLGTLDARLIALDAEDGHLCASFGGGGTVDLNRGIEVERAGTYYVTSPPVVVNDVLVVGSGIADNRATRLERGIVRGFDVRTGRELWAWDPTPTLQTGDEQSSLVTGAANAWAPLSADPSRDLVFVPTGSASPDYWGGERPGPNADANSVIALNTRDGSVVWRRQLVHHDLWDYDVSSQPVLTTIRVGNQSRDVVIAASKAGFVFVLDRATGVPVFPIEERAVPASDVSGEAASSTQPFPAPPFRVARYGALRSADAWGFTPIDQMLCAVLIARLRSEGIYTPTSVGGSVALPGYGGGVNWGGITIDPIRQLAIIPVMDVAMAATLVPRGEWTAMSNSGDYPKSEFAPMHGAPFGLRREPLASPLGAPCSPPPWGRLVALDLARGRIAWDRPLGTTGEIAPVAMPLGSPLIGGAVATSGGVTIVGATTDARLRGFDTATGRLVWEVQLPAGAQSTPSLYTIDGRAFLVVAAGGSGKLGARNADTLVAFALPQVVR